VRLVRPARRAQARPGLRVRAALLERPERRALLERELPGQLECRVRLVTLELLDRLARLVRRARRARTD
jgi:hypothetical protein